ncbi:Extra-cytoplasmic solute receptor [Cupriavidus necator]|uniref:Extra-cytoplasmic solute receptor n=1 Tax=Cupriavidus necator TaxID=106590 RepID=A0A1K0J9L4_CUPNE|nr:Extra-cytoplasmic solute receptor [Cupriavidus necator]
MRCKAVLQMLLAATLAAAAIGSGTALAQEPASGTVRLLVGYPPGGTVDLIARGLADKLKVSLGTTVIVDNRPGAGGRIAAEILRNSPPDGRTVLVTPGTVTVIAPLTFRKLRYDPAVDFTPVAHIANAQLALSTGASSPYKTLPEFVGWMRQNPAKASFGTSAAGSQLHFLGLMLAKAIQVDMTHIPYKGGAALMSDEIGGQVPAGIDALPDTYEFHKAGKIRILATSGAERAPYAPDVPTFREQGYPGIEGMAWFGAYMHAKTPKPVVEQIGRAMIEAVRQPDLRDKLTKTGLEPTGLDAAAFAAVIAADRARWKPIVEASGFVAD